MAVGPCGGSERVCSVVGLLFSSSIHAIFEAVVSLQIACHDISSRRFGFKQRTKPLQGCYEGSDKLLSNTCPSKHWASRVCRGNGTNKAHNACHTYSIQC